MSYRSIQDWFGRHRNLAMIVVLVVLVLAFLYVREKTRSMQGGAMAVLECVNLYDEALTAAETTAVDSVHPIQGLTDETTCLTLRRAGRLDH